MKFTRWNILSKTPFVNKKKQAGAELCQAQQSFS